MIPSRSPCWFHLFGPGLEEGKEKEGKKLIAGILDCLLDPGPALSIHTISHLTNIINLPGLKCTFFFLLR